jgi:hypothetical protein
MPGLDNLEVLFVITAFLFQIVLIVHFGLRRWRFETAMRLGPLVYALSLPAVAASLILWAGGKSWEFWLGGLLYFAWAIYGYVVEYVRGIQWRSPLRWPVGGPYLLLYLATVMFYWWPLATIYKPLWYIYAVLFIISTVLNATSHRKA